MNLEDIKAFLKKIRLYDARISTKSEEIERLREFRLRITSSGQPTGGSGARDKIGNLTAKIVDLENELAEESAKLIESKSRAVNLIDKLDDQDQHLIAYKRYFEYKTWNKIAEEMKMSERNVLYVHGKALQALRKI
ncbi:MAG: hypothetical protein ACI3XQ_06045 [Eubacteriales bacterium]